MLVMMNGLVQNILQEYNLHGLHASLLKNRFIARLQDYDSEILSNGNDYSPAIVSFRINNEGNAEIVRDLQENGVFCSYISESDVIRVSFEITRTERDIDRYFQRLDFRM